MLNLFTFLVFLLVFTGVFALRAFGRRQRRAEAVALRLAQLRGQWARESGATVSQIEATESILLAPDAAMLRWWPWLGARLAGLRGGLRLLGWHRTLRQRVLLTACASFVVGMLLGRMTAAPALVTLVATLAVFVLTAVVSYQSTMARHMTVLAKSLPEAIDAITRICRAGVPLHSAFSIAADHLQGPLVPALREIDQWLRLGVPLRQVMQDSARRVPLPEYRFFAVILIISQESGGRLGDTLDRLSATLRARAELKMKVLAKTSEARASTKIVALLVPGVLAYMYVNAPDDFRFMFSDPAGIKVMVYAGISVGLGLLITQLMVRRIS